VYGLISGSGLNLRVTAKEITLLSSTDTTLFVCRTNLVMSNLRLQGDLQNDALSGAFFLRPIYLQEKSVTMIDVDIQLTGMILRSFDPMSLYLKNLYVDFYAMMGGFYINIECNYPEAYLNGVIHSENITAVNAQARIAPFRIPFLVTSGPEDIYLNNSNLYVWGSLQEDRAIIETYVNVDCLPNDDRTQYFIFDNTRMSMSDNPKETKFTTYFVDFNKENTRKLVLKYLNSQYTNQYKMPYPTHQIFSNLISEIYVINCTFTNVT